MEWQRKYGDNAIKRKVRLIDDKLSSTNTGYFFSVFDVFNYFRDFILLSFQKLFHFS